MADNINVKETRSYVHSMVHRGRVHECTEASIAMADGGSIGMVVANGSVDQFHMTFSVAMSGNGHIRLYEDPTLTSSTLCLSACAMNRETASSIGISASFGHTPVFELASASIIHDSVIAGGTGPGQTRIGGDTRSGTEWVLARDKTYILAACNRSGGAVFASITAEGYIRR